MVDDPDAMWKPGFVAVETDHATSRSAADAEHHPAPGLPDRFQPAAGGRRPQRGATRDGAANAVAGPPAVAAPEIVAGGWFVEGSAEEPGRASRPWRPIAAVLLGVAALVLAAGVAISVFDDDPAPRRPEPGEIGADERRLPAQVEPLWSTVLSGSGNALASSVIVEGRDLVVAVADDGSRNRTMIVGVDATSGQTRWRRSFSFAPPEASLLGVIDGVVLVEQRDLSGPRLLGLASADGATLWEHETRAGQANTVLLGTDVITNVSPSVDGLVTFIDPLTGVLVGDAVGEVLSTDLEGTWYFAWGSNIVSIDLSEGWSEPVAIAGDRPPTGAMAIVDGRLLTTDAAGQISEASEADPDGTLLRLDGLPRVDSMFPAGGSSFVGINGDEIFGAEVDGDTVRATWRRTASLRSFGITERGLVLSLNAADAGFVDGVDLMVIDAVTGDRLAAAGAVDDLDSLPLIVGDGFVTRHEGVDGTERVGFDLDGEQLWRLPVSGRLRVGDELVVVMTNTPAGYELTAYGTVG